MRKIELQTDIGDHVAFVEIPPFSSDPQVILWGARVFVLSVYDTAPTYREAFAYAVPEVELLKEAL